MASGPAPSGGEYLVEYVPGCPLCLTPLQDPATRWCQACARDAVSTREDVVRHLPGICHDLNGLDLALAQPVKVELVDAAELARLTGDRPGSVLGITMTVDRTVVRLAVLRDLPVLVFGQVVAHEYMHAWLTQQGAPALLDVVIEGVCELAAYAWLRSRRQDPRAVNLMRAMKRNPDPTYGRGLRLVHQAAWTHGTWPTLESVVRTGRLPSSAEPTGEQPP